MPATATLEREPETIEVPPPEPLSLPVRPAMSDIYARDREAVLADMGKRKVSQQVGRLLLLDIDLRGVTVDSRESAVALNELMGRCKRYQAEIEAHHKDSIAAAHAAHKAAIAAQKRYTDPLGRIVDQLRAKLARWDAAERARAEAERIRAEEEARKASEASILDHALALEEVGDTDAAEQVLQMAVVPSSSPAVNASPSPIKTKKVTRWRVTDKALVPDQYKLINETALNAQARALGMAAQGTIAGVEFYEETVVR